MLNEGLCGGTNGLIQCQPERILTLAAAPVGRIPVEARDAALAVPAGCQVLALLAHALVDTLTVTITLTSWQGVNKAYTALMSHKHTHAQNPWGGKRTKPQKKQIGLAINSPGAKHGWICKLISKHKQRQTGDRRGVELSVKAVGLLRQLILKTIFQVYSVWEKYSYSGHKF